MKKIFKGAIGIICVSALTFPSCDLIEDCGNCELVTENGDGEISYGTPLPFCGDALQDKINSSPTSIGSITTWWNCY